jgi:glycosyltransferase involved in cell wall biosynthesis
VAKTIATAYEYLRLDNRQAQVGICAAYNRGIELAQGQVLVFVHEDVFFMQPGWGPILEAKFAADPGTGLVGVAGSQYLFKEYGSWGTAGRPFVCGRVIHEEQGRQVLTVYSQNRADVDVVAVDGLFFAVRGELLRYLRFDEIIFDGFHFYDIDFCMQVRRSHRVIVTSEILVKHLSAGKWDQAWQNYAERFRWKYDDELPASCTALVPDLQNRVGFESFLIRETVPTIE